MPPSSSEKALRRMVADLTALHPADISAVLGELDPGHRGVVEELLRDYTGFAENIADDFATKGYETSHLSPWLRQKIEGKDGAMTDHTRKALAVAAAKLFPSQVHAYAAPASRRRWFGRLAEDKT
jgi:hypothetical protein